MAGQYYDSESSLFYNWNRYYNPAIGRYISSDPIGLLGGINIFGYVKQNPTNWTDSLGLSVTVTTEDGTTATFTDSLNFSGYLNKLRINNKLVKNISFYGHGAPNQQSINEHPTFLGPDEYIRLNPNGDGSVQIVGQSLGPNNYVDLGATLRGIMAENSSIDLYGCNVDGDTTPSPFSKSPQNYSPRPLMSYSPNLTSALSTVVPNVLVSGSPYKTLRYLDTTQVSSPFGRNIYMNGVPVQYLIQ